MSVSFDDSVKVFLQKSVRVNLVLYAENVEEFLLKKYLKKGSLLISGFGGLVFRKNLTYF